MSSSEEAVYYYIAETPRVTSKPQRNSLVKKATIKRKWPKEPKTKRRIVTYYGGN